MDDREPPQEPLPIAVPAGSIPRPIEERSVPPRPAGAAYVPDTTGSVYKPRFGALGSYLLGRLAGFFIDVFGIAFVLATFIFNAIFTHLTPAETDPLLVFGINSIALKDAFQGSFFVLAGTSLAGALFFIWLCETIFGTTLGKLLFGLAIRRGTSGRAGPMRIIMRNVLRPLDALVIGGLLAAVTPKHQRIGDFAGGTIVVRSPLGWIGTVVALIGFIAIGYAQLTYGGGISSAAGVIAQAVVGVPRLLPNGGGVLPSAAPSMLPAAADQPTAIPSDAPTDAPTP